MSSNLMRFFLKCFRSKPLLNPNHKLSPKLRKRNFQKLTFPLGYHSKMMLKLIKTGWTKTTAKWMIKTSKYHHLNPNNPHKSLKIIQNSSKSSSKPASHNAPKSSSPTVSKSTTKHSKPAPKLSSSKPWTTLNKSQHKTCSLSAKILSKAKTLTMKLSRAYLPLIKIEKNMYLIKWKTKSFRPANCHFSCIPRWKSSVESLLKKSRNRLKICWWLLNFRSKGYKSYSTFSTTTSFNKSPPISSQSWQLLTITPTSKSLSLFWTF